MRVPSTVPLPAGVPNTVTEKLALIEFPVTAPVPATTTGTALPCEKSNTVNLKVKPCPSSQRTDSQSPQDLTPIQIGRAYDHLLATAASGRRPWFAHKAARLDGGCLRPMCYSGPGPVSRDKPESSLGLL